MRQRYLLLLQLSVSPKCRRDSTQRRPGQKNAEFSAAASRRRFVEVVLFRTFCDAELFRGVEALRVGHGGPSCDRFVQKSWPVSIHVGEGVDGLDVGQLGHREGARVRGLLVVHGQVQATLQHGGMTGHAERKERLV